MTTIVVAGGGFAGVWAALGAARVRALTGTSPTDLEIVLVSSADDITIRPRLYEDDPQRLRVALDRVLGPVDVRRVAATLTGIDTAAREVTGVDRDGLAVTIAYDRLVLATGSRLVTPDVDGAEYLFDVDTMTGAARLHAHIASLPRRPEGSGRFTAVVVGGGFTGLEVATELPARLAAARDAAGLTDDVRVVLVDRGSVPGAPLGPGPRPQVEAALAAQGVETVLESGVRSVDATGVVLTDGTRVDADTVVWTAGMAASPLTAQIDAQRDRLGRLAVDEHLRVVGVEGVYAAGDTAAATAEEGHPVMQSCQHAVPLGKVAGHNVAADVLGLEPVVFAPDPYVTCLDLGPGHAVFTTGWDREVGETGADAKALKKNINEVWIYPPVDDRELILARADHAQTWPMDETPAGR